MKTFKWSALALCSFVALTVSCRALAQDPAASYPSRVVKLISPFAPGGATDVLARVIAQKLGESWKQTVIVDNKAGGGGTIAAAAVARGERDGHTLLLGSVGPVEVLPTLMKKLPYDPERDLVAVDTLVNVENVLVVHESVPAKNVAELIAHAKANPGKLHFGSSGIATTAHLAGEIFEQQAGVDLVHVPFRGGAQAVQALLAGDIQIIFSSVPSVLPHIKSGRVRALGVTGQKPLDTLPGVRPIRELGLPSYRVSSWYGVLAPGGTPPAIVNKINGELGRILAMPEVKATLLEQGWTTAHTSPAKMARDIHLGIAEWKVITEKAGIKLD